MKSAVSRALAFLQLNKRIGIGEVGKVILLGGVCLGSFLLVQFAFVDLFKAQSDEITIKGWGQYLWFVFALAILPAVFEELVFRGLLFQWLRRIFPKGRVIWAVIISAALFSAYHMSLAQTVYQFILGIIFAMVVLYSGKLVLAMLLHFVNNFFIITYVFIAGTDNLGGAYSWGFVTVITMILLACLGIPIIIELVKSLKEKNVQ